jgi:predicted dehydrogenase
MSKLLGDEERKTQLRYQGGSMFELGCHLIDSVVRVLGKPEKVTPHVRRSRPDGYGDNMLAVLDYPEATVTLRSAMIEVDGGSRRQFVVCGEHGTCEIRPLEPPAMRLTLDRPRGAYKKGRQEVKFDPLPRYAADWTDFARAIRGQGAWEFTPEHDLAVQETVLRASGLLATDAEAKAEAGK